MHFLSSNVRQTGPDTLQSNSRGDKCICLTGRRQSMTSTALPAAPHGLTSCRKLSSSPAWSPCDASMTFTATALPFHVAAITQASVWLHVPRSIQSSRKGAHGTTKMPDTVRLPGLVLVHSKQRAHLCTHSQRPQILSLSPGLCQSSQCPSPPVALDATCFRPDSYQGNPCCKLCCLPLL
jgi:hypothetical protein